MADSTPEKNLDHADYAGFWVRFFAACIDMLIYTPVYYAIMLPFGPQHPIAGEIAFVIFALITYAMFFASKWQASPGMYLLHFHVSDNHGARIGLARAIAWGIVSSIGCLFCFAGILYLQTRFDLNAVNDLLKSCREQNIALEDCAREVESLINIPFANFIELSWAAIGMALFMFVIWALSVALPKDKTGFHNLICGTRFVKGRA